MFSIKAILFFALALISNPIFAGTTMKVQLNTGSDDLRGGNTAFIKVNYTDNTTSPEYVLSRGMAGNTAARFTQVLTKDITNLNQVRNIEIRHDGSPRAGNPFDTYDNWNLQHIRVGFVINGVEQVFSGPMGNPLARFTGAYRIYTLAPQPALVPPTTSNVKVFLTTGTGELRGGNTAFMTVNYADGSTSPEFVLGGGFSQNSVTIKTVRLNKTLSANTEITSIMIRHDGNPRAGNPFDTYGNWTLQALRVALVMPNGAEINVVNYSDNPLVQFSGAKRTAPFPYRP